MTSYLDDFYKHLPTYLQNGAMTLYGWRQYRIRFGEKFSDFYARIQNSCQLSPEEIRILQSAKLKEIVAYAAERVPYYMDFFANSKINPLDIDIDNFTSIFPIIEKQQIIERPSYFHALGSHEKDHIVLFTSGTSGSPMEILCSKNARRENYAFYCKLLSGFGVKFRERSVTFAGRLFLKKDEQHEFWRTDYFNRTLYCSSYHLSEPNIPSYIQAIEAWNPHFIDSYPSAIAEIAAFIVHNDIKHSIRPKVILTSSETLLDHQFEYLKRAFNCPIVDQYGCTEMAVMAYRIDSEDYFIPPLYSIAEFLSLGPVESDASEHLSELICTGLLNKSMPLIRYRIGDSVAECSVDPAWPLQTAHFKRILGRSDDLIKTPDGRRIGRLDPAFKGIGDILEAQIVQDEIDSLIVLVTLKAGADRSRFEDVLSRNLKERTSQQMRISFDYETNISKTQAGKFKSVVSLLKR